MKKIPVENLKPGMAFSKAVYIDSDNLLIESNIPLKENDIKRLMRWGVVFIETEGDIIQSHIQKNLSSSTNSEILAKYERLLNMRKRLIEVHGNACYFIEQVYTAIRKDLSIDLQGIQKNVNAIIELLKENSNIFIFLNGFDDIERNYLVTHSVNVTFYSLLIGQALNYTDKQLLELGTGTILIDAGMTKIPVYIVHKQSNLTDNEFQMIKAHPVHGYKALTGYPNINKTIACISLQHHEQFDGKGYPRGLKGKEISEYARITSIADSFESQISKRSYREKVGSYHAMKNLVGSGVSKFDPEILRVFLSIMSVYPIGSLLELNDNSIGIVVGSIAEKPLRPIIKLIFDSNREKISDTRIINLVEDSSKFITKVLDEKEAGINLFDILWGF
ncbi:MAG: HD-GYP domain-containing protein [Spirochaetes bacterium]|nr:HD-GYP domain-containing protein [Spirochaetota bacterium]